MPKVSVIVPVYNAEKHIARCIESVKAQTLTDWEMILVDDASSDNSVQYLVAATELDDRIHYIINTENIGPMVARHKGVMAATGDYITFLDSDDEYLPDSLQRYYSAAIHTDADIVSGNLLLSSKNGEVHILKSTLQYGNDRVSVYKSLLRFELLPNLCNKLFKSPLLKSEDLVVFEKMKRGEDACVLYQVVGNCSKAIQIEDIVYHYIVNEGSSSHKILSDSDLDYFMKVNRIRIDDISGKYEELETDLFRHISLNINAFISQGYSRNLVFESCIEKYNLGQYVNLKVMFHYFNFLEMVEIVIKRYAFPLIGRKFDGWKLK